jgi:hypothetical protein
VNEATKHVAATDAKRWGSRRDLVAGQRRAKVEPSVRATFVVVLEVLARRITSR